MTDRIPGAPGRYQASLSPDQLEKMQNGEPFAITLSRDDAPVVEGTPYSKAAVLPDDLAKRLCPDVEDPAPKDALAALSTDFVVDRSIGELGDEWSYRLWNSGIAECWKKSVKIYTSVTGVWGSVYSKDNVIPQYRYPFNFVEPPVVNITPRTYGDNLWLFTGTPGDAFLSPSVSIARPTPTDDVTMEVYIYAIGRWK